MDQSDEQLLNFDTNRLADWRPETAERALAGEHGSLYRNHLAIAHWIDGFAENLESDEPTEYNEGYVQGIREIAAHLRQADLLPTGVLFENRRF